MLKRYLRRFFCGVCVIAALTSCGEEDLGGGIGEFTTVTASAVSQTNRLESDLITGNTCTGGVTSGGAFETDTVDVDFSSTALFPSGNLNLLISKITVQYTPVNPTTTPALPDFFITTSQTVTPGSTAAVPVAVVPDNFKFALATRSTQNLQACSADYFEYYVNIIFEVSEPGGNGKTSNVTASLNVAVADRE